MIPASYMFKNAFRQAWEEAEVEQVTQVQKSTWRGLLSPLLMWLEAALHPARPLDIRF